MPVIAIGAIDLVAFMLGLAAMLALFAFYIPVKILGLLLRNVPVIGSFLNNALASSLQAAMKAVAGQLDAWANGVTGLLASLGGGLWWLFHKTGEVISHLSLLIQVVEGHAQHAESTGQSALDRANQAIIQGAAAAEAYADQRIAAANAANAAALAQVEATLENELNAVDHAHTLAEQAGATAAATQLQSVAASLGAEIGTVQSDVQSVASELFGTVEPEIAALQDQVANITIPNVGDLSGTITSDIEKALAAAGVAAIPGLLSQVGAITTEVTQCLEPLCDTVTPQAPRLGNLGKFLQELESLGFEAALLALAAECLTNPAAVVNDVSATVHEVGDVVVTGVRDLIGV